MCRSADVATGLGLGLKTELGLESGIELFLEIRLKYD